LKLDAAHGHYKNAIRPELIPQMAFLKLNFKVLTRQRLYIDSGCFQKHFILLLSFDSSKGTESIKLFNKNFHKQSL